MNFSLIAFFLYSVFLYSAGSHIHIVQDTECILCRALCGHNAGPCGFSSAGLCVHSEGFYV